MVVIRCTHKLLRRIPATGPPSVKSTARLGDWSANLLGVGHRRFVLLVSEPTRLPVLLRGVDVRNIAANLPTKLIKWPFYDEPEADLIDVSLRLSETPIIAPFGGDSPQMLTRGLLA